MCKFLTKSIDVYDERSDFDVHLRLMVSSSDSSLTRYSIPFCKQGLTTERFTCLCTVFHTLIPEISCTLWSKDLYTRLYFPSISYQFSVLNKDLSKMIYTSLDVFNIRTPFRVSLVDWVWLVTVESHHYFLSKSD